jgi:UDP-N-acetylglucosamine 2-epimerase
VLLVYFEGRRMKTKRTIVVFAGTRPEIIKMAPIVHELRRRQSELFETGLRVLFCFSGQHTELAEPFLKFFEIEPDFRLNLMNSGQSLGQLTARAFDQLDSFLKMHPQICAALVQGDTTTAFAAAMTAFYHRIPVGHIEAGLRTSDISEPFPEELNRRLIGRVARWHYAPTTRAKEALLREGITEDSILVTGNTGIDALMFAASRSHSPENHLLKGLTGRRLVLVTAHRRENIGAPLVTIAESLAVLANMYPDVHFVLPVHRNPQVASTLTGRLSGIQNFHLVEPLSYRDLVWVMKHAEIILTDSGGIQEEAPSLRKPVLVLRNETERPEAIEFGTSIMVGATSGERIVSVASDFLSGRRTLRLKTGSNPYGDGVAAARIVDDLLVRLGLCAVADLSSNGASYAAHLLS